MTKKVFYDGKCSLCTAAVEHVGADVERVDIHSGSLPPGVTFEQSMRDMYLVDGETLYKGSEAVLKLAEGKRLFGLLAHLRHVPGLKQLAAGLYRLVAANRYLFRTRL